jgi:hypothetical protein
VGCCEHGNEPGLIRGAKFTDFLSDKNECAACTGVQILHQLIKQWEGVSNTSFRNRPTCTTKLTRFTIFRRTYNSHGVSLLQIQVSA